MFLRFYIVALALLLGKPSYAGENYEQALKRAQYILIGTTPTDDEIEKYGNKRGDFRKRLRHLIDEDGFYRNVLRYHEKQFGTGLQAEYIDELRTGNDQDTSNKFAKITCARDTNDERLRCRWASSAEDQGSTGSCPASREEPVSVFWYPGIVAWACPSVVRACGHDLSRCFVQYGDQDAAKNAELGTTEIFDSTFAVVKSLSKQGAGIATRLATENYPYNLMMKSGLSAVDNAVLHFYRQDHHFRINDLRLSNEVKSLVQSTSLSDSKFVLMNTSSSYESAGIISTFGWLRRYAKNRTRGNELYERALCRKFTSELPRVFPQDPGNLRETPGCSGCHATLDPLADFWKVWGEEGDLYQGEGNAIDTTFANREGKWVQDLGQIVTEDTAFATCTTMHVWEWLMGRQFYFEEAELRGALANYFIDRGYSFKELVYAIASHPAFMEEKRGDAAVTDPLEEPPLGTVPDSVERECEGGETYAADVDANSATYCESCHNGSGGRADLRTQNAWEDWGSQAVNLMGSGQMPPGMQGPEIQAFRDKVRCWLETL